MKVAGTPENIENDSGDRNTENLSERLDPLTRYYSEHNYSQADAAEYTQDPEWRSLMQQAYPDYELPPLTPENARAQLTQYMSDHNYGPEDFRIYSQDPEWRALEAQAYPDYDIPPRNNPDNLGGWHDIKDKTALEKSVQFTNPGYDYGGKEYQVNCQRCVGASEMRARGYDVEANPCFDWDHDNLSVGSDEELLKGGGPFSIWEDPDVRETGGSGMEDIEKQMKQWGDGTRAEIKVSWVSDPSVGHVFIAEQKNGRTYFYDPQNGDRDCSRYFRKAAPDRTMFARIDNLQPSEKILECCSERRRRT